MIVIKDLKSNGHDSVGVIIAATYLFKDTLCGLVYVASRQVHISNVGHQDPLLRAHAPIIRIRIHLIWYRSKA